MYETQYLKRVTNVPLFTCFPLQQSADWAHTPTLSYLLSTSARKLDRDKNCTKGFQKKIYKSLTLNIVLKLRICLKFENYFAKGCWKLLSACRDYPLWSRYLINSVRWQAPGLAGSFCFSSQTSGNSDKQGPAGRYFQLRDGSGSGIGKNFGFGSGIGYICKTNYQSGIFGYWKSWSGIFGYILISRNFCMTC